MKQISIILLIFLHFTLTTAQVVEYTQGKVAFEQGDNETAITHFNKSMEIYLQSGDTLNETYANLLNNIASALYRTGKAAEAIQFGHRALKLCKRLYGSSSPFYAKQCVNLATYYYEIGEYGMCITYENFAIRSYDRQNVDYFTKTGMQRLKIMFEEAEADGVEIKMGFSPQINMKEVFDTNILREWKKSDDLSYLRTCKERVDKMIVDGDSMSLDFLHAVDDLTMAYIAVNDTAKSTVWIEYGIPRKNALCGEKSIEAARSYYIYGQTALARGDILTAKDRADEVINILNQIEEHDDETYLNAMMLSCSSYLHMGILGTVRKLCPRLVEVADSLFGKDSRQYDAARFLYAQCLFRLERDTPEIIIFLRECLDWRKKHFGDNHPDTVNALVALATFLCEEGENDDINHLDEAERLYDNFYRLQKENVKDNFLGMSIEEQRNYWRLFRHYYLDLIPMCSLKKLKAHGCTSMPSAVSYNAALFGKGILLNSENLMREALRQSQNRELKKIYNEIARDRLELMNLLSLQEYRESAKVNNYRESINRKQEQLSNSISSFSDYTSRLAIEWTDIRKHLGDKDAAIEFINMRDSHQEFTYFHEKGKQFIAIPSGIQEENRYAAAIITAHTTEPILLSLFDMNDIGDLYFNGKLRQQYLSELLWKPILKQIGDNIENIYFSPMGILHNLPIESLEAWDGNGLVSDRVNLYRLSSTRILSMADNIKGDGGVVYGGLNYDIAAKDMVANASRYRNLQHVNDSKSYLVGGEAKRDAINGLSYLIGTKEEADIIYSLIKNTKIDVVLLEGNCGTEESFKDLNGKNNRVIHIGTHGFFNAPVNNSQESFTKADLSMISSGLYMSGANNAIMGEKIPDGVDDGVLTSEEISSVDLRGLDMVTLSACQTALGEITDEGVFGLQRGFKKAGAQSILMSLWKVDDEATCLLMTEFYKNWIGEGKTKHDALELAKKTVRSHKEKGWDNPKYWAAFILLDALD